MRDGRKLRQGFFLLVIQTKDLEILLIYCFGDNTSTVKQYFFVQYSN